MTQKSPKKDPDETTKTDSETAPVTSPPKSAWRAIQEEYPETFTISRTNLRSLQLTSKKGQKDYWKNKTNGAVSTGALLHMVPDDAMFELSWQFNWPRRDGNQDPCDDYYKGDRRRTQEYDHQGKRIATARYRRPATQPNGVLYLGRHNQGPQFAKGYLHSGTGLIRQNGEWSECNTCSKSLDQQPIFAFAFRPMYVIRIKDHDRYIVLEARGIHGDGTKFERERARGLGLVVKENRNIDRSFLTLENIWTFSSRQLKSGVLKVGRTYMSLFKRSVRSPANDAPRTTGECVRELFRRSLGLSEEHRDCEGSPCDARNSSWAPARGEVVDVEWSPSQPVGKAIVLAHSLRGKRDERRSIIVIQGFQVEDDDPYFDASEGHCYDLPDLPGWKFSIFSLRGLSYNSNHSSHEPCPWQRSSRPVRTSRSTLEEIDRTINQQIIGVIT